MAASTKVVGDTMISSGRTASTGVVQGTDAIGSGNVVGATTAVGTGVVNTTHNMGTGVVAGFQKMMFCVRVVFKN